MSCELRRRRNAAPRSEETHKIAMYRGLGISTLREDNTRVKWMHKVVSEPWGPLGPHFEATRGHYSCIYNLKAIIALDSESPDYMGVDNNTHGRDVVWAITALNSMGPDASSDGSNMTGEGIIPLEHWSDIVFLQWKQYCEDPPDRGLQSLRYIFQENISNGETRNIVFQAAHRHGTLIRGWNRETASFPFESDGFRAVLATRNGVAPAHSLAQHQRELGRLMIEAVTCFFSYPNPHRPGVKNLSLCFHVNPF